VDLLRLSMVSSNAIVGGVVVGDDVVCMVYICEFTASSEAESMNQLLFPA